jgi:hypothetical protein
LYLDDNNQWIDRDATPTCSHQIIDCTTSPILTNHGYTSIVSDLHNALAHRNLAVRFIVDELVFDRYCRFISKLQGVYFGFRMNFIQLHRYQS